MPHTLLLADDSVTIQRVIELTFADEDVQVVAVSDGDQAIARMEANPPDIVLADIGMPGKSGYEVAQYMRQSPRLRHIPIVLLTGAFEPVDQQRATEAGCDGVLAKPFEPQIVIGRVRELLARSVRVAAPARSAPAAPPPAAAPADSWPAARALSAPPAPATPADAKANYFDQLDAAFATLTNAPASSAPPPAAFPSAAPSAASEEIDWFASQLNAPPQAAAEPWDLPGPAAIEPSEDLPLAPLDAPSNAPDLDIAPPKDQLDMPLDLAPPEASTPPEAVAPAPIVEPAPVAERELVVAPPPAAPQAPAVSQLPSISDAFAALLAAEEHEARPATVPVWPVAAAPSASAAEPLDMDVLVERVTREILDRLSERVIPDAIADITLSIAERLVLEEIDRIKSSIK